MQRRWYKRGAELLAEISSTHPARHEVAVWYLGQCGFVFKSCEVTVYIDAVLNDLTDETGCTRRHYPAAFEPAAVQTDYFLCTHGHNDHLALPTLETVARACPSTRFVIPKGCVTLTDGIVPSEQIIPASAGHTLSLPGLTIRPVSAAHPVHETTADGANLALCYSMQMDGVELLHLGDTYLTERLLSELESLPSPQLYFAPVNGSDYFRTARNCIGNLNPLEAARLAVLLGADLSIPTHFDMVYDNTADPLLFALALWQENPAAKWHIPALGERLIYRS